jgi:hypothetical protein
MKKIKQYKKWGIYQNSPKEIKEVGFNITVIHPDVMGSGLVTSKDSDIEMDTLENAISWIDNY